MHGRSRKCPGKFDLALRKMKCEPCFSFHMGGNSFSGSVWHFPRPISFSPEIGACGEAVLKPTVKLGASRAGEWLRTIIACLHAVLACSAAVTVCRHAVVAYSTAVTVRGHAVVACRRAVIACSAAVTACSAAVTVRRHAVIAYSAAVTVRRRAVVACSAAVTVHGHAVVACSAAANPLA